jgi:hypothetical protein
MLRVNTEKSGTIGDRKLKIAVDGDTLTEVQSAEAKQMATAMSNRQGFGNGGLSDTPCSGAVDEATDDFLEDLNPERRVSCYRTEFTFQQRI